ncbi:tigger transposable element-derived protein 6-like [Hydractinia symbiolongicarpus]|uniref:tigger transposable element-derived protein 6-like n=1 Tax=Hydractinia symbiolongicarpus TaxID=13093 RepID=UPI00254DAB28|nr:tigger transposable element-derived protein 6-like [Hydractinia symbiolongicarpus]
MHEQVNNKSFIQVGICFIFYFRHNVTFKTVVGESSSVQPDMIASWFETTLPTLLTNYKLEDIYNADEFGLFYQCLPNKTYHYKSEKCSGGKNSKVRITGLAAANAVGDKLPMFVIGKSKKPRCFKNVTSLPCRYRAQKKSWMDSSLFEEWVREIDAMFLKEGRKIVLIIDNCPAHPDVGGLSNIKLIFLPPNTTSVSQPMDQGVIRCLKSLYRQNLVNMMIQNLEKGKDLPKVSILRALQILVSSWDKVKKETIVNCFKKSKIFKKAQQNATDDIDDPFKQLEKDLTQLRAIDDTIIPADLSARDVVDIDQDLTTIENPVTDEEILESVRPSTDENDEEHDENADVIEVFDEPVSKPTKSEINTAVETLQNACLFTDDGNDMQRLLLRFEDLFLKSEMKNKKQTSILSFFDQK